MSSAVGCPLGDAAGLIAAAGELVGPCANDGMTARVEQKRIAKQTEVFMVAVFQDAARSQAGLRLPAENFREDPAFAKATAQREILTNPGLWQKRAVLRLWRRIR